MNCLSDAQDDPPSLAQHNNVEQYNGDTTESRQCVTRRGDIESDQEFEENVDFVDDDSDGESVLVAILKRRMNKQREGGQWEYLCRWKGSEGGIGHSDSSWETREALEEAGFIPQVDAWDAKSTPHALTNSRNTYGHRRTLHPKHDDNAEEELTFPKNKSTCYSISPDVETTDCQRNFHFSSVRCERIATRTFTKEEMRACLALEGLFAAPHCHRSQDATDASKVLNETIEVAQIPCVLHHLFPCLHRFHYARVNPSLALAFLQRWQRKQSTHVPIAIVHGTVAQNLHSICELGLIAGGSNGVPIHNGSAFGRGVYTTRVTSLALPREFAEGANCFIVGLGLVPIGMAHASESVCSSPSHNPTIASDAVLSIIGRRKRARIVVFRDSADVCPLWMTQCGGDMIPGGGSAPSSYSSALACPELCAPLLIPTATFLDHALRGFSRRDRSVDIEEVSVPRFVKPHLLAPAAMVSGTDAACGDAMQPKVKQALASLKTSWNGGVKTKKLKAMPRSIKQMLLRNEDD